jgi:hypothetical protein
LKCLLLWSLATLAWPSPQASFSVPTPAEPVCRWEKGQASAGELCWYRYKHGQLVAGWIPSSNTFRWYKDGAWSDPVAPPWEEEERARASKVVARVDPPVFFGVDPDKISPSERYRIGAREVSKREAIQELGAPGGQIPNDAANLRLTIIGSEEERRRVLEDLTKSAALASWRDKLVVQDYAPADWAVSGVGFVTSGKPTLYLQQPDGKVLLRLDQYDGPEPLAEALRKADPNYRPDQDPNGKPRPQPPDASGSPSVPSYYYWLAGAVLLLLLRKR